MRKPRVVLVHPPSKMFPYEVWPPAFDGLDVEILSVECRSREETLEAGIAAMAKAKELVA